MASLASRLDRARLIKLVRFPPVTASCTGSERLVVVVVVVEAVVRRGTGVGAGAAVTAMGNGVADGWGARRVGGIGNAEGENPVPELVLPGACTVCGTSDTAGA